MNNSFIDKEIIKELKLGKHKKIITRFPPEPNGHLHIGSAFAINISYSIAKKYNGKFNLRFDDTNPNKEDIAYVHAIEEDFRWMGFEYGDEAYFGSDYSEQTYNYAKYLIEKGRAFVCDLSFEEMREYRGTLTTVGKDSPYKNRTIKENLELFEKMKNGYFDEGKCVLRAIIDMKSPNISLRDPVIYRVIKKEHYRTLDKWCIYPMYDFAHPIQDYIEGITHSLCSNEFVNHRPLYEWVLNNLDLENTLPRQIEFGRLNLTGVVTSKRYLRQLVSNNTVDGWDDPRLPTIKGLRRRGYTQESIFAFLDEIGIPKTESTIDFKMLEYFLREDLKGIAPCLMAVLDPLKVVITNLEAEEPLVAGNHFKNEELGKRDIYLTKEVYIEREDFSENPPPKYKRLVLDGEVRLKHGFFIKCNKVIKDKHGKIIELHCTYGKETKSGSGFTGRKVKGTIHWVSSYSKIVKTNVFEDLFLEEPRLENLIESVNKNSLIEYNNSRIEFEIESFIKKGVKRFQFIRNGYFYLDEKFDSLVFNRIVSLKGTYKK